MNRLLLSAHTASIEVSGFGKCYGERWAVREVSFSVHKGEVFGLLGPNGAGKTSILECVVGLRSPTAGRIQVLGYDPHADRAKIAPHIGVQPQEASLFPTLTVEETLTLFASLYPHARDVCETIEVVELTAKRKAQIRTLSGGQRQRVLVAVALIGNPELLFLDEPTSGLDPQARRNLWAVVETQRASGRTTLLTTHYMEEAERLCDRILILDQGGIVAMGTPGELIQRYVPVCRIHFELPAGADLSHLRTLVAVSALKSQASPSRTQVTLYTSSVEQTMAALVRWSDGSDALRGMRVESGTLEDLFLHVTGRPMQEKGVFV